MSTIYPVDLQVHSTCSDGTETPTALVQHAARLGINVLALNDHDSTLRFDAALITGQKSGMTIIPALEISTTSEPSRDYLDINILGYGIQHQSEALQRILTIVYDERLQQKIRQVERMQ